MLQYLKYCLWAAQQYPDPRHLHMRGGIGEVVRYLKTCASASKTREILVQFGAKIHPEAKSIGPWITIHEAMRHGDFRNLTIGASAYIGPEVFLDLTDEIIIENSVTIGMRTIILTHINLGQGYPDKPVTRVIRTNHRPTVLKRGCSTGAGAIVLSGVTVGEDAVIGAGVVVRKNVSPRTVVASSVHKPDRVIPDVWFQTDTDH